MKRDKLCFSVRCVASFLVGSRSLLFWLDFFLIFFRSLLLRFFWRNSDFPLQHIPIACCNAEFGGFGSKCEKKRCLKERKMCCGSPDCLSPCVMSQPYIGRGRSYWSIDVTL
jgi:hypothetical protein